MTSKNVVIGQKVSETKVKLAKVLRRNMTGEEAILWQHLRANRLNGLHFRRQQIIDGFIADFYCHSEGIVIEADGDIHGQRTGYDAERDRVLSARGLRVFRVRNEEIRNNLTDVLEHIVNLCNT
ncbi:MAG: restriction endonuclease [Desulfobacteraceae bacterium IS3]|nr:MAG: restriction endonuclease [Desulfobacteraceae bacterium IS3]